MIFRRKSNIHQKLRFEYWCSQPRVKDSGRQLGTWPSVGNDEDIIDDYDIEIDEGEFDLFYEKESNARSISPRSSDRAKAQAKELEDLRNRERIKYRRAKGEKSKLRVIRTARDLISINEALQEGYIPLFKMKPKDFPPETKFTVCQHKKTGEIIHFEPKNGRKIGVWRAKMKWFERLKSYFLLSKNKHQEKPGISEEWEVLFEGTSNFPSYPAFPYAAYLIPKDIKIDEMVYIEDYIEPQRAGTYEITSGNAIWTGKDLWVIPPEPLPDGCIG